MLTDTEEVILHNQAITLSALQLVIKLSDGYRLPDVKRVVELLEQAVESTALFVEVNSDQPTEQR